MRKSLLILFLFCGLLPAVNSQDIQRFSERQIIGTARYVGMGGSMSALGADMSTMGTNPAGMAVSRMILLFLIRIRIDGGIRFQVINGNPELAETGVQNPMDHGFRQQCAVGHYRGAHKLFVYNDKV